MGRVIRLIFYIEVLFYCYEKFIYFCVGKKVKMKNNKVNVDYMFFLFSEWIYIGLI